MLQSSVDEIHFYPWRVVLLSAGRYSRQVLLSFFFLFPIRPGWDGFRPKRGCTVGTRSLQSVSLQAETRHHPNVKTPSIQ